MSTNRKKPSYAQIIGLSVGALALVTFTVLGILWVLSLRSPERLEYFQQMVASLGVGGWFVLLAIQYVQIVIAFIPGGPIQIVAGALYGALGGLLVCIVGTILATATVFALVKKYGRKVIALFVEEKDILKYDFLGDAKKLEMLVLGLFFVPGTPKDALTYLFALTPIPMGRFMLLSTCARIPAVLTSVLAGDSIMRGEWLKAGIFFFAITLISAGGLLLHKKISAWIHARDHQDMG